MPSVTGKAATVAVKKSTGPWGDSGEVAVGALDGLLVESESIGLTKEFTRDEVVATPFVRNSTGGNITVEGSLPGPFRYEMWDLLLALVIGADAVTQPDAGNAPSVYDRAMTPANDVIGEYATVVIDKISRIHVVPTFKPTGFTINGDAGGVLSIEVTGIGNNRKVDSIINSATEIGNVTYRTHEKTIPFNIGVIRLNEKSAGALGAGNIHCPNSFSLSYTLPLEGDQVACGDEQIAEPDYTGIPEIKLTLGFPRVISTLEEFITLMRDETIMKGDIVYTGPVANPGETTELNHFWKVEMPHMKLMNADELVEGLGKIPVNAEFELFETDTAPTGMAGILKPLLMTLRNTNSVDYI